MTLIQHLSDSNEWGTPGFIVEPARELMGGIDLDPASSLVANETVKAKMIYDVADDGLTKPWHGKVFLNPPGGKLKWNGEAWVRVNKGPGRSAASIWWQILANKWQSGEIEQAFFVGFTLEIMRHSQFGIPIQNFYRCYPMDRIAFIGGGDQPGHGNVLAWLPSKKDVSYKETRFKKAFYYIGLCEAGISFLRS